MIDVERTAEQKYRLIVKLETTIYTTKKGMAVTKKLNILQRKSNLQLDDVTPDVEDEHNLPLNVFTVPDGVYELTGTNFSYDYETGYIDDLDYILKPYNEQENEYD